MYTFGKPCDVTYLSTIMYIKYSGFSCYRGPNALTFKQKLDNLKLQSLCLIDVE